MKGRIHLNKIVHEINLDFSLPCAKKRIYTVRHDTGSRILKFILSDNSEPYVISADSKVIMYGIVDGVEALLAECDFSGNEISVPLNIKMSSPSATLVYLKIISPDGSVLTTPSALIVNMQSFDIDETVMGSEQYSALIEAIRAAEGSKITSMKLVGNTLVITYADGDTVSFCLAFSEEETSIDLDTTLKEAGKAADSKAVGDAIEAIMGSFIKELDALVGGGA